MLQSFSDRLRNSRWLGYAIVGAISLPFVLWGIGSYVSGPGGDTVVEVNDEELNLRGPSIEDVGQTAADIEQLTRVSGKDTRVFQDGVYITEKPSTGGA